MLIPTEENASEKQNRCWQWEVVSPCLEWWGQGNEDRVENSAISLQPFQHSIVSAPSREHLDWWKPLEEWQGEQDLLPSAGTPVKVSFPHSHPLTPIQRARLDSGLASQRCQVLTQCLEGRTPDYDPSKLPFPRCTNQLHQAFNVHHTFQSETIAYWVSSHLLPTSMLS